MGLNLDKIQAQREAFDKHPVRGLSLEDKIYYLKALVLVLHLNEISSSTPLQEELNSVYITKKQSVKSILEKVLLEIDEFNIGKIKNNLLEVNKCIDEIENSYDNEKKEQVEAKAIFPDKHLIEREKEYFKLLIYSFGIKEDFILELFDEFEIPDEDEIFEIFEMIKAFKLEKYLLLEVLIVSYIGQENENIISNPAKKDFFYDLCDVFKVKDSYIEEIELFAKYVYLKTKRVYELLKVNNSYLKFVNLEYLLKLYNIKKDKFNEGDYRIYFEEYFSGLKDDILFFGEYDYESGLKELEVIESLFFEDYDYETGLNEFVNIKNSWGKNGKNNGYKRFREGN